jgi:DNA-binding MarR family transcriptional regulator
MSTQLLLKHESKIAASDATIAPMATTTGIGEEARTAWSAVFNAHRRVTREAERRLQDAGLPPLTWYEVLAAVDQCPEGPMNQAALAAQVQVSPSGLSRLIYRMVARGLIERRHAPGDRRAAELVLTDEATAVMRQVWDVYGGVLAEHFGPAVAGHEATVAEVFSETSDSLEGICRTRLEEAGVDPDAAGGDPSCDPPEG